jgi:hypothetical protein
MDTMGREVKDMDGGQVGFQFDLRCVPQWVEEEIEVIPLG